MKLAVRQRSGGLGDLAMSLPDLGQSTLELWHFLLVEVPMRAHAGVPRRDRDSSTGMVPARGIDRRPARLPFIPIDLRKGCLFQINAGERSDNDKSVGNWGDGIRRTYPHRSLWGAPRTINNYSPLFVEPATTF
jgi:hypothetical protein